MKRRDNTPKTYWEMILINGLVALFYWGVSHLNWLFFHHVGILPMPIWPAAAVALIAALYWGWGIAPALAVGTLLANHYSLGATWTYAACVAVMNTAGPLMAVWLVKRKRVVPKGNIPIFLFELIAAGLFLAPALTASGGIGSQWLLGMIRWEDVAAKWIRWFMAHSVGALLFVSPVLVFSSSFWQHQSDNRDPDWLKHAARTTLVLTFGLALLLWFGDTFLRTLWFKKETVSLAESLLPIRQPQELLSRVFVSFTVIFAGGAVSRLFKSLADSHRSLEQSNLELQESETLQRTLLANLPAGVIIIDPTTKTIENVNSAAVTMFGRQAEQIIGQRCHQFLCPAHEGACPVCDLDMEVDNEEREMLCADGAIRPVLKSVKRLQIRGREMLLECFIDITERKRAEEALGQAEEKYRSIFENAIEGIFQSTPEGRFLTVNPALARIYGFNSPEELLESVSNIEQTYLNPNDRRLFREMIEKDGKIEDHHAERLRKDGSRIWVSVNARAVSGPDGEMYYEGTLEDITSRKQAEEERRKLQDQLAQSQKMEAIGTLAGGIAHDFNNILTVIIGSAELALINISDKNPLHPFLMQIQQSSRRAADLVKQILAFSRQKGQEVDLIQPDSIVKEALKMLRASLPSTIEIQQHIEKDPGLIMVDPTQIHQILMNLCTNAAHAMRENGGLLEVRLTNIIVAAEEALNFSGLNPGPYIQLTVRDTGHGMESKVLEHIFDPYFTTKKVGEGTGLGLAVVYGIIKKNQGTIKVYSEPGKGSRFEVFLPRVEVTEDESQTMEPETIPGGRERILLVDDEKELVALGQTMLRSLGYQVTSRINSLEALEIFRTRSDEFDLIITDMTMPHLTGAELSKRIRQIRLDIPIVLCTGFSELIDEEKAKELDIQAFLMKPIGMQALAGSVRRVLDKRAKD
jgi:PAS domain S-box-containing protein